MPTALATETGLSCARITTILKIFTDKDKQIVESDGNDNIGGFRGMRFRETKHCITIKTLQKK